MSRFGLSLRALADAACISKSVLQRLEQGAVMTAAYAEALDRALRTRGWFDAAVPGLQAAGDGVWDYSGPRTQCFYRWAGDFEGPVWVGLRPPGDVTIDTRVELKWGPLRRTVDLHLVVDGVALITGKARNDTSQGVTIALVSAEPIYALFGVHTPPGNLAALDLSEGWVPRS